MVPDEVNVYLWRKGFHLLFPMRGKDHWRLSGCAPRCGAERRRDFRGRDSVVAHEAGSMLSSGVHRFSTYRIHHRRLALPRPPLLPLGDAAHIHSPVGAQGMNTGLQDAYNLAGSWPSWQVSGEACSIVPGRAPPVRNAC